MKKTTFYSTMILLTSAFLVFSSFQSTENAEKYLYVRVFESLNSLYSSSILISNGESITKTVKLSVMRPRNLEKNVLAISKTLNEVKSQGYRIVSSSSGGNQAFTQTDYVFQKE